MILVVDDDPALRELARSVLVRDGHDVVAVASARAALAAVAAWPVDAVVSDFQMPGGSGLELLADLRAQGWRLPFVLVTAAEPADLASVAGALGVTATLRKPFALGALSAAVAAALAGSSGPRCDARAAARGVTATQRAVTSFTWPLPSSFTIQTRK